jgi:hypothetical protein
MRIDTTIGWCLGSSLLLGACVAEAGRRDPPPDSHTLGLASTSDDPAATTSPDASGSGLVDGDSTSQPPPATATSTTGDDADSGPEVFFDLGAIPDMPEVKGCQQAVDIVFTMDVSTTMGPFIQILSNEILAVDAAIADLELPEPPHYGLAVFVDDAMLLNGGAPYADAVALQSDFDTWAAFTASNQQVGGGNSNSTWTENSLDALYFAADEFAWRPADTTIRMVIHTTDDTFWNGPTVGNNIPILHGYAETVQRLQDQMVRTYVFTDDIGGSCNCEDVTPGWSSPYMGMLPIPDATDGGMYPIAEVLGGAVSLADAINIAVEESYCDMYTPQG